jgi:hypothetical protein
MFLPEELGQVLCGEKSSPWNKKDLESNFELGNPQPSSKVLSFFFDVLEEFNTEQQQLFLRFLTSCTKLPIGGKTYSQDLLTF